MQKHIVAFGHGVGFFSMFTQVITILDEYRDKNVIAHWNSNSLYWEPTGWNGVYHNVWEYYFEPTSPISFQSLLTQDSYATHKLNSWDPNTNQWEYKVNNKVSPMLEFHNLTVEAANRLVDQNEVYVTSGHANNKTGWGGGGWQESDRVHLKNVIDKHVKIKPVILDKVDKFYNERMAGRRVVGIHFRGTDKHTELQHIGDYDGKGVRPIGEYLRTLDAIDKNALVYLATDCQTTYDATKMYLGTRLLSQDGWIRSNDGSGIHLNPYYKKHRSNKALHGEQVVIDWLLLSRCSYFVHGFSNLSASVLFMNPNLQHVNVYR